MQVHIKHVNKIGIVSPLKGEKSLPTSLFDDGRESSVFKGSKVNDMLKLYLLIMERGVVMVSFLLPMKALKMEELSDRKDPGARSLDSLKLCPIHV